MRDCRSAMRKADSSSVVSALKTDDRGRLKRLFRRGKMRPGEPKNPQIIPVGRYEFTLGEDSALKDGTLDTATGVARLRLRNGGEVRIVLDRKSGVLAVRWPEGVAPACSTIPAWKERMHSTEGENPLELAPPVRFGLANGSGFVQTLPVDPAVQQHPRDGRLRPPERLGYAGHVASAAEHELDAVPFVIAHVFHGLAPFCVPASTGGTRRRICPYAERIHETLSRSKRGFPS